MAIDVVAADVIAPFGELDCDFFPKGDMDLKLPGWLRVARAKVAADSTIAAANQNEAVKQWVYFQAFTYIAGNFAAMPNSVSVNKGADSVSFGQDRPAYWAARAARAEKAYNDLPTTVTSSNTSQSVQIPLRSAVW